MRIITIFWVVEIIYRIVAKLYAGGVRMKRGFLLAIFMLSMMVAVSWTVMALPNPDTDSASTQAGKSVKMGFQSEESSERPQIEEAERIGYIMVDGEDSLPVIEGNVYRDDNTMTGVVKMGNFKVTISQNTN